MTTLDIVEKLCICVNEATDWRWLKKLHFLWKMARPVTILRNGLTVTSERKALVEWYQSMTPRYQHNKIFYTAESPFNLQILQSHGWSLISKTPNPVSQTSRGSNVLMNLPQYRLFVNPCEEAFSLIKNQVRRDSRPTGANDIIQRMRSVRATVTNTYPL
ncbi:hypothetical protein RF11_03433 [Thelohanellus kitauei]|uniref:Tc1-like transposase DDE domain-containing protein n=1 Tax=Thelohanellus kitauei TaxID=669202 RepID=A0A0C2MHJ0_THEKT|nr:hypothetical protein RF11_03433 [Thelohanellus kitauei]